VARARARNRRLGRLLGLGFVAFLVASPADAANEFKLRPGARGKLCVRCHEDFGEVLKRRFVHTPIAKGDCAGCHNPHTSDHERLLSRPTGEMCQNCHDDMVPAEPRSSHQVFVEGECMSCHDPHAADHEMNLIRPEGELCVGCHKDLGKRIQANQFQHEPVTESCLECHEPHVSAQSVGLLKKAEPKLWNYPVAKRRCTGCHDPHGSNTAPILYDNVHEPVAEGKCSQCHARATSASPFALEDSGFELCEGCHYDEVADIFNKSRLHWPIADKKGCLNCHAPHASPADALMAEPMLGLCGRCHADTVARQERSPTKHPPIAEGECAECHSPHSSDNLFLLNEASEVDLCATCHEWQTHATHPIGERYVDPRNQNLTVVCSSCHRTHGTEYEHFLYFETTNQMCIQCHVDYRR
jgi:predicted CXXCH cytochrome family protein